MNSSVLVARKEAGLTQDQLAAKLGINHADILRVEKHGWIPPADIRQRLAAALGKTEEDLFGPMSAAAQDRP